MLPLILRTRLPLTHPDGRPLRRTGGLLCFESLPCLVFSLVFTLATALTHVQVAAAAPMFLEVASAGPLATPYVDGVSADGTTVVGQLRSTQLGNSAFFWTPTAGATTLDGVASLAQIGSSTAPDTDSRAEAVSGDGSIIVGSVGERAFRWERGDGATLLDALPASPYVTGAGARATAVSDDGRYIAGTAHRGDFIGGDPEAPFFVPVLWLDPESPITVMDFLGTATDVSNQGIVVGSLTDERPFGDTTGFRVDLVRAQPQFLPGFGISEAEALAQNAVAISADGDAIVGTAQTTSPGALSPSNVGYLWSGDPGLLNILDDEGLEAIHAPLSSDQNVPPADLVVRDISSDGSTVVGSMVRTGPNPGDSESQAFVWTRDRGLESLEVMLAALGVDLEGWDLDDAVSVSADGRTIVGMGRIDVGGALERPASFYAVIPEPSSGLLLMLGLGGIAFSRAPGRDAARSAGTDHTRSRRSPSGGSR